jgi:acyl carrier protein
MHSGDRRSFITQTFKYLVVAGSASVAGMLGAAQVGTNPPSKSPGKTAPVDPVEAKVRKLIVEQLGVDPKKVTGKARFAEDLGADSLDKVELTMALEEAFGIEIPDADGCKILTVKDAVQYVKSHPGAPAQKPQSHKD